MANKAELKGKATLNTKDFHAKLRNLRRGVRKNMASLRNLGNIGKKALTGLTVAAAGTAAAITKLTADTLNYTARLRKQSSATGLSIKRQQELNRLAGQFQVQEEALADAVKEMSMRMTEQAQGGAQIAAEAVKLLGTDSKTLADIMNKDVGRALEFVAKRMQGLSRGERGVVLDQLFGGQGGEQVRRLLVQHGQEIDKVMNKTRRFGMITKQQAKSSQEFNQSIDDLKRAMAGVRNKGVLTFIQKFGGAIKGIAKKINELRQDNVFMKWIVAISTGVLEFYKIFITRVRRVLAFFKGVAGGIKQLWKGAVKSMQGWIMSFVGAFKMAWVNIKTANRLATLGLRKIVVKALAFIVDKATNAVNKIIKALNKIPKVNIDLAGEDIAKGLKQQADEIGGKIKETIDKRNKEIQKINEKWSKGAAEAYQQAWKNAKNVLKPLINEQAKALSKNEETRERIAKAQKSLNSLMKTARKAESDTKEKTDQRAEALKRVRAVQKRLTERESEYEGPQDLGVTPKINKALEERQKVVQQIAQLKKKEDFSQEKLNRKLNKAQKLQQKVTDLQDKRAKKAEKEKDAKSSMRTPLRGVIGLPKGMAKAVGGKLNVKQPRAGGKTGNRTEQAQLTQLQKMRSIMERQSGRETQMAW